MEELPPKNPHFRDFQLESLRAFVGTEETSNAGWLKMRSSARYTMSNQKRLMRSLNLRGQSYFSQNTTQLDFKQQHPVE
jgi:hypothetical protein